MRSRLTRRGWGVVAIVVGLEAVALLFGAVPALNAVVLPLAIAVIAGLVTTRRADRPEVRRLPPEDGFVGELRTVRIESDHETPASAVVHDEVPEGVDAAGNRVATTVGDDPVEYRITYRQRGAHRLGPVTVAVTDVLGLARRQFHYALVDEVLAYPPVYELSGATRAELSMLSGGALDREREQFNRLREYQPTDPLRDVHWKTSAKRPDDDLVVKEFAAEQDLGEVTIAGSGDDADRMAAAVASVAVHLLVEGVAVGVVVPGGQVDPDVGAPHRTALLELLARTEGGDLRRDESDDADVRVEATGDRVVVRVDDRETTFASLTGRAGGPDAPAGDAAGGEVVA